VPNFVLGISCFKVDVACTLRPYWTLEKNSFVVSSYNFLRSHILALTHAVSNCAENLTLQLRPAPPLGPLVLGRKRDSLQFANTFKLPYGLNIALKYFVFHDRLTVIKQVAVFASSWVTSLRPRAR
jgi:hypothetical protein